jgi:guanosine-3',5'-bis(diphosphate) 3'-pyrophosphohydrolase
MRRFNMSPLELKASRYAFSAHYGVLRKYGGDPYIAHPAAVADLVRRVSSCTDAMLAAAWLHDVVEDCPGYTLVGIETEFGPEVANLVEELTDVAKKEDGNRAVRVRLNREHSSRGSAESQSIKLADIIHNTCDICKLAPSFAPTFLREKAELVAVLTKGDAGLRSIAERQTGSDVGHDTLYGPSDDTRRLLEQFQTEYTQKGSMT